MRPALKRMTEISKDTGLSFSAIVERLILGLPIRTQNRIHRRAGCNSAYSPYLWKTGTGWPSASMDDGARICPHNTAEIERLCGG
jgi:hypothetical protein